MVTWLVHKGLDYRAADQAWVLGGSIPTASWAHETRVHYICSAPLGRYNLPVPGDHWEPALFLIERYSPPAIRAVWADQHRFELWLRIEVLACEAWASLGRIPASALPKIRQGTFDTKRIAEVEGRVGHDVVAFLTVINESIG